MATFQVKQLLALSVFVLTFQAGSFNTCFSASYNGNDYKICNYQMKKTTAVSTCNVEGTRLVVLETQAEFDYISAYLKSKDFGPVWVGATKSATTDDFFWDNTTLQVPQAFFKDSQTSFSCVFFQKVIKTTLLVLTSTSYELNDADCSSTKGYICESIDEVTTDPPTTLVSTTTAEEFTESRITTGETPTTGASPVTAPITTAASPVTVPIITDSQTTVKDIRNSTGEQVPTTLTTTSSSLKVPSLTTLSTLTGLVTSNVTPLVPPTTISNITSMVPQVIIPNITISTISPLSLANITIPPLSLHYTTVTLPLLKDLGTVASLLSNLTDSWSICSCGCPLDIPFLNETLWKDLVDSRVKKIEQNLQVDKETLSSTVRKKTSATDERPSAQSVGYAGIVIMTLVFGSILIMDLTHCAKLSKPGHHQKDTMKDKGKLS